MRHRTNVGAAALVLLLAASVGGWYAWRQRDRVEPPTIDPATAEPEVAEAITAAHANVLRSPDAASWGQYGKVLVAYHYDDEANFCFAQAERLDPKEARWPYLQGMTLLFSDTDRAIACFERAVRLDKTKPAMQLRLAETLLSQGRLDEALEHYRRLLELDPGNPRGSLGLSRLTYLHGDLKASRDYLGRSLNSPLTQKASHTLLAEIEQRANDSAAAARERALAAQMPDDQDWFDPVVDEVNGMRLGKQARLDRALKLASQQPAEALTLLSELERQYPDWEQPWLARGRLLLQHRDYAGAGAALHRAIQLAPGSVEAHFALGVTLFQRGDYRAAAASFREATRLKPDYALAQYNLGHCLRRQGDRAAAIAAFRAAVRSKPGYAPGHANLGELLAEEGNKTEAVEHLRLAVELNPEEKTAKKLLDQLQEGN